MDIKKKIYLGKCDGYGNGRKSCKAYVTFALTEGRFTASGEIWNVRETDIISGGQNLDHLVELFRGSRRLKSIHRIWKRWHLNDMRAGCEHQRKAKWEERPIDPSKPLNSYGRHFPGQKQDSWNMLTWISETEHPEGLLSRPCPECGYKYGTEWKREEIPDEVIKELITISEETKGE